MPKEDSGSVFTVRIGKVKEYEVTGSVDGASRMKPVIGGVKPKKVPADKK